MIYTSKRRKLKDFVKTRNWSYYFIFLVLFATVIACIFIGIKKAEKNKNSENSTSVADNESISQDIETQPINSKGRFKININLANCQISVYEWNSSKKEFSETAIKYMPAGINNTLTEGTYSFKEQDFQKNNWYTSNDGNIYRYYTGFSDTISFHTALYEEHNNKNSLNVNSYNTIGTLQESSGITLLCSDAKWIYENCSYSSEIHIYSDESEAISSNITTIIPVPDGLTWDPSDKSYGSTFSSNKVATIHCVYDFVNINQHANVDFVKTFVKATDEYGNDISSYVFSSLKGTFDTIESLEMTFYVADIYGNVISDSIIVNVVPREDETEAEPDSSTDSEITETETESSPENTTEIDTGTATEPVTDPSAEATTEASTESVTDATPVTNTEITD